MATQSVTNFDKAFKDKYWPAREKKYGETFLRSNALLSRLKPRDVVIRGRKLIVPIHTGRSRASGARAELATLPAADIQETQTFEFVPKSLYHALELSGQVIDLSKGDEHAFWEAVDFEVRNGRKDFADYMNRQCYNDGTGIIANITSAANSATQTVSDSTWLEPGMTVVVAAAADGTSGVEKTISTVTHSSGTVVFNSAVDTSTGTWAIFPAGLSTGNVALEYGNAIQGLEAAISASAAYGGLSAVQRAAALWSQATVESLGGALPDEMAMLRMMHMCQHRGGGKISLILTSPGVWRLLGQELKKSSFWQNPVAKIEFGFSAIIWQSGDNKGGIPIMSDPHCPSGTMYFIDESTFYLAQAKPLGWRDFDGQVWRANSTVDKYAAELLWRGNVVCINPRGNGKFTNVATDDPTL